MFREEFRFQNSSKSMAKLDREIEEVLGRAVTNNDLEMLYKLDLKMVNQINSG